MHDHLRNETEEEMLEETHGETEIGPVVTELEGFQGVTLEFHLTVEVLFIENLHGNLALATIGSAIMLAVEAEVVLDGATGILGLFVLAGRDGRSYRPKGHENGDSGEDSKEDGGVETTANLASEVPWDQQQEGEQQSVGEAIAAGGIGRYRGIFNGRVLGNRETIDSQCLISTALRSHWNEKNKNCQRIKEGRQQSDSRRSSAHHSHQRE